MLFEREFGSTWSTVLDKLDLQWVGTLMGGSGWVGGGVEGGGKHTSVGLCWTDLCRGTMKGHDSLCPAAGQRSLDMVVVVHSSTAKQSRQAARSL